MDFNYFDIAILVIILLTALIGFMMGLVWMGIFIATWAAAILLAIKYKDVVSQALPIKLGSEVAQSGLAALLIFLGVLIVGAIINYLFSKAVAVIGLGTFDRILGTGLGIVLGALAVTLIIMLLSMTELPDQTAWQKSRFIPKFQDAAKWIQTLVPENLNQYINDSVINKGDFDSKAIITPSSTDEITTNPTNN